MARRKIDKKRILNCIPSRNVEKDWAFDNAVNADILTTPKQVPTSKDLRATWWKINDQGDTGSCVGWASADSVLRWHFVKTNELAKNKLLSVRFIWMSAKETDEFTSQPTTFIESDGTSLKAALDIARKFGMVGDSVLPFKKYQLYKGEANTFYAIASRLKIASYFNLGTNPAKWKSWLANQGPILTRLGVDETWDNATNTKGNLDVYKPNTVRGGHAVAFVGYTKDRFIIRNSWGTGWGDKGFAYASIPYAQEAFTEAYGVTL